MLGQRIGEYKSTDAEGNSIEGIVIVNIDKSDAVHKGEVLAIPNTDMVPKSVVYFTIEDENQLTGIKGSSRPVNPYTDFEESWDKIKKFYHEDVTHANELTFDLTFTGDTINVTGTSDNGLSFTATAKLREKSDSSRIKGKVLSWDKFKEQISTMLDDGHLYRGQTRAWPLQTGFHRLGRSLINEFTSRDIPRLHQKLCGLTEHYFNLEIPNQNGAFFNLIQHHGYPTPLLDWSHSPFVAAFFAFLGVNPNDDEPIRIYIFHANQWRKKHTNYESLNPCLPHISIVEFLAINNPRLVPQQAVTTVTNLDDMENFLIVREEQCNIKFIEAIDIPASERTKAMRDLKFMGITSGTLFPGIDGVCAELKEQFFN